MNIFIISAQNIANSPYKKYMETIVNTAKKSGHKVYADHVFKTEISDPLAFAHEMNDIRKQSQALIAEVSIHSTGVGHDIRLALSEKKPTLIIYAKKEEKQVSEIIRSINNRLVTIASYSNISEVQDIVKKFINNSKSKLDTKFILIIPPEIDRYLEWASDYKRMHKAQLVREAVENYMGNDKDWEEYQKEE